MTHLGPKKLSSPAAINTKSKAKTSDKSKRPVTKSASVDPKEDDRSAKTPSRKTPAQVKAESAARKAKAMTKSPTPPLKKQNSRESMEKQNSKESSVEKQEESSPAELTTETTKIESETTEVEVPTTE